MSRLRLRREGWSSHSAAGALPTAVARQQGLELLFMLVCCVLVPGDWLRVSREQMAAMLARPLCC